MPLAGTRLGPYEILELIGKGGMGEVYRARDTKLGRDVAVKVLPSPLAEDDARLARFEREAKLLASLNHPNIASIHGFEESDGVRALVLELVEGPTLKDRIEEGAVPVEETIGIAKQIARALEAGHEAGVIHRDVKPANIKLKEDGTVKVLDYGLAKALEEKTAADADSPLSQSPTLTRQGTRVGAILGTVGYMSPEQARGEKVDKRSDVWSFACVMYEMLTGRPAFEGDDVADVLAAVAQTQPSWDQLPELPQPLNAFLRQCMVKDSKQRLGDIRDMRLALEGVFSDARKDQAERPARPIGQHWWIAVVASGLAALVTSLAIRGLQPEPLPRSVSRFEIEIPSSVQIRNPESSVAAISPKGDAFVFNTTNGLYLRRMNNLAPQRVPGTDGGGVAGAFFSPDGDWLGYNEGRTIKKVALSGGAPIEVVDGLYGFQGASWTVDHHILVAAAEGIFRTRDDGGELQLVVASKRGERVYGPRLLPDRDGILFSATLGGNWDDARVVVQSIETGERTVVWEGGSEARLLPTQHLLYARGEALYAIGFNPERRTTSGAPVELLPRVSRSADGSTGAANYDVSNEGTLLYIPSVEATSQLTWFNRNGNVVESIGEPGLIKNFTLSPDERHVATRRGVGNDGSIWITDLERSISSLLVPSTFRPAMQSMEPEPAWSPDFSIPIWSSDGRHVAFSIPSHGLVFSLPALGGEPTLLAELPGNGQATSEHWSFDSRSLTAMMYRGDSVQGAVVSLDGSVQVFDEARNIDEPHFSPDDRWVAYSADRGSGWQVYLVPNPPTGERVQVSAAGGSQAQWRGDSGELFFLSLDGTMMAVEMEGGSPRSPVPLFDTGLDVDPVVDQYAVSADGKRFLFAVPVVHTDSDTGRSFVIALDWFEELKRFFPETQ